jgi:hypothetical protein
MQALSPLVPAPQRVLLDNRPPTRDSATRAIPAICFICLVKPRMQAKIVREHIGQYFQKSR